MRAGELGAALAKLRATLDARWAGAYGTWTGTASGPAAGSGARLAAASAAPRRDLLLRVLEAPEPAAAGRLQAAAVSYLQLLDPVWGGAFELVELTSSPTVRRSRVVDGSKLAASQAQALEVLAWAWARSGETRFRNGLEKVDAFLQDWLSAPGGGYFTAQLGAPAALPAHIGAERYWSLRTEHERRRFGLPPLLRELHGLDLALLVPAYLTAHAVTGEPNYLRVAERLGRTLQEVAHAGTATPAARLREALALLLLHEVSVAEDWWSAALRAAGEGLRLPPTAVATDAALAVQLGWRLRVHGEGSTAVEPALDRLLATGASSLATTEAAELAAALALLEGPALEARLYGDAESPGYRSLLAAAATSLPDPRRVIVRHRSAGPPRLELCRRQRCSAAIVSAEALAEAAAQFLRAQP